MMELKSRRAGLLLSCVMILILSGCGIFAMPEQLEQNRAQIADLQRRHQALVRQLDALREMQEEQLALLREVRADDATQFSELQRRVDTIEQMLKHSTRELERVARGMGNQSVVMASSPSSPAAPDTVRVPIVAGERLYDAAYSNLLQGRYPLAIMEFREYLQQFPDGDLADDSQYWIGESYYAQSELETAAQAFQILVDRYADSVRVPAAHLKAGFCYADLGEEELARAYLRRVVDEFPYSDEAIKARDRLERIERR